MKIISSAVEELERMYDKKLHSLKVFYEEIISDHQLFLMVECSEKLKNLLLNSCLVNVYSRTPHTTKRYLVLEHAEYGLWQLEFYKASASDRRYIDFSPFTSFRDFSRSYSHDHQMFKKSDKKTLEFTFDNHFDFLSESIDAILHAKNELVLSRLAKTLEGKQFNKLVQDRTGIQILFDDLPMFNSIDTLADKINKELDDKFIRSYSDSIKKSEEQQQIIESVMKTKNKITLLT